MGRVGESLVECQIVPEAGFAYTRGGGGAALGFWGDLGLLSAFGDQEGQPMLWHSSVPKSSALSPAPHLRGRLPRCLRPQRVLDSPCVCLSAVLLGLREPRAMQGFVFLQN